MGGLCCILYNRYKLLRYIKSLADLPKGLENISAATGISVFFTIVGSYNELSSNPGDCCPTRAAAELSGILSKGFCVCAGKKSALGVDWSLEDLSLSSVCTTLFWL